MRTRKRPGLRNTIERALLERDRREIASVERLMEALRLETPPPKTTVRPRQRRGR